MDNAGGRRVKRIGGNPSDFFMLCKRCWFSAKLTPAKIDALFWIHQQLKCKNDGIRRIGFIWCRGGGGFMLRNCNSILWMYNDIC